MLRALTLAALFLQVSGRAQAPETPRWIWNSTDAGAAKRVYFRKTFSLAVAPAKARLIVTCDDRAVVYVNGEQVTAVTDWKRPSVVEIAPDLRPGSNVIAVEARNDEGRAGLIARLEWNGPDGQAQTLVTDASWRHGPRVKGWQQPAFAAAGWQAAVPVGTLGQQPWGDVFAQAVESSPAAEATPAELLTLLPGFVAERLYSVPKGRRGSWVSLTTDPKGRLLASDQGGALYRITPGPPGGQPDATKVTRLDVDVGAAQGLLFAYDSLYVTINGRYEDRTSGLYRLRDTDGDDEFDQITLLRAFDGAGEHGPHGLALGPDGLIYVVAGNHTKVPEPFDRCLPPHIWQEDILLPRHWDANGHAKGILAPGGFIARTDADGKRWELVSIGYRNAYDLAFSTDGELFSWDSDMEWDMGTPWYRPTRVTVCPPGSDYGWRSGSGNPPAWFADSLPPVLDVGPGSPVGMTFGTGARFPTRYQKALFLLDWTFGTVYALHLEPKGASYTAVKEEFAFARPWPLTDVTIGTDGAMYLTIGGRGTQSGLYRIRFTGSESTEPPAATTPTPELRLRRRLEALLATRDADAVTTAWPYLAHSDRFVRFAARAVIEHQPVATWQELVFAAKEPRVLIHALVALARCGDKALQSRALESWLGLDLAGLDADSQLDALRACSLLITRMGPPARETALRIAAKVDALFPTTDYRLNRDLASLLAVLGSPTVVARLLEQMRVDESQPADPGLARLIERNGGYGGPIADMVASKPISQRLHYANALSVVAHGWTPEQRREYFTWLALASRESKGGDSFQGFVRMIRAAAMQHVPVAERAGLAPEQLLAPDAPPPLQAPLVQPKGPGRDWTVAAASALAQRGLTRRDFAQGKAMYQAVQCAICHRFGDEGASVGPDLTSVGTKFSSRDLLESILEPSKVISDQYQTSAVMTRGGASVFGKIVGEENGELVIAVSPFDASLVTRVKKAEVTAIRPVELSTMPPGLVNRLNESELLDLLAFLLSGGNPQDKMFAR